MIRLYERKGRSMLKPRCEMHLFNKRIHHTSKTAFFLNVIGGKAV